MDSAPKKLHWMGASKKDLRAMPDEVRGDVGYALYEAQMGEKSAMAKTLKGFGSAGILEVITSTKGSTYRAVYTVKFADAVYVLHCFQKKSTKGIGTPKPDMDVIRNRLKEAEALAKGR